MYPILFDFANITVKTYHVMMFLGIIAGFITLHFNLRKTNAKNYKNTLLFAALIFIPFIFAARAGYLLECMIAKRPFCVSGAWYDIVGPVSLWWGLVFAVLCAFPVARLLKTDVWDTADVFSPSIAIGGVFIRIGCFFNGCCFGTVCPDAFPFAVVFPIVPYDPSAEVFRYPVQLYSSLAWLFIFIVLMLREKKRFFKGEIILDMAFLFSFLNFFIEFYRYHIVKSMFSIPQIFSIMIMIISLFLYYYFLKKHTKH